MLIEPCLTIRFFACDQLHDRFIRFAIRPVDDGFNGVGIRCQINADELSAVGFRLGIHRIVIGAEQVLVAVAGNQDIDAPYLLQHGIGTVVALHTTGA